MVQMTEIALHVDDMGRRGEGVAHHEGRALFIPGTLPGEQVKAEGGGERLALSSLVQASPDRIAPSASITAAAAVASCNTGARSPTAPGKPR